MPGRTTAPFEKIVPVSRDYATLPIDRAFNWIACAPTVETGEWYLVVFRSVHRASADEARLSTYDNDAFLEATRMPGFVRYFRGVVNDRRECLSFCLWDSREHAREAARKPSHLAAVLITNEMYESYRIETYFLHKGPGAPTFEFTPAAERAARQ